MTFQLFRGHNWRLPLALLAMGTVACAETVRQQVTLEGGWRTALAAKGELFSSSYVDTNFYDRDWREVSVPHNWESYEGYRQLKHGNLHGTAWYRLGFQMPELAPDERAFLLFEGVGSYATIWVNGKEAGRHAGGLTTFTLDITEHARPGQTNMLAVRADHPSGIRDLPWVCGGCELAYGFSEGTQPFGIFRPVHLVITNSLRVAPFGVHVWNDQDISAREAVLHVNTEVSNHGSRRRQVLVRTTVQEQCGDPVFAMEQDLLIGPGESRVAGQKSPAVPHPRLWSMEDPYLYRVVTEVIEDGDVVDLVETSYGIRWIEWPDPNGRPGKPLLLNGEPVFINGVADYEHQLGASHAFTSEQVSARAGQIRSAGFNAFRDAHHPHNLRFNEQWDQKGLLWWTQFGAHIWFENEDFQDNYKSLLRDWIRERRNSPSLFLYGLQNESKLPADFAQACMGIIREMDPTASTQRLVVTCNGGMGTDWDVPQNWSGTYGGNLAAYGDELREQRMVGEYGAWRSLDFHSEGGFIEEGHLTEDRMGALMETKVRLAETVRNEAVGHFAWPFTTHQNPGRNVGSAGQQSVDGIREWDRIGPANNKGLMTSWGEPLDVFYMYRSNYTDPRLEPMVYIVSHTWPDRWSEPGTKDSIVVYSNADEVELFNGYKGRSLGTRKRGEKGTHFRWDGADIQVNVLYAEARLNGETVATDIVSLHHLPVDPRLTELDGITANLTEPARGWHYLYRVNAGGGQYTDTNGNVWQADRFLRPDDAWGSLSWASRYSNLHPFFGSKRRIHDPVSGTVEDPLFQSFRYGREELRYRFAVPEGLHRIELYFIEPWYGTGGGMDCGGWRLFDVAINGETVLHNLDLWSEAGRAGAIRKVVEAAAKDGQIEISFPRVPAGEAVLSAIAVASQKEDIAITDPIPLVQLLEDAGEARVRTFLDTGDRLYADSDETITFLSWELREAAWIRTRRSDQVNATPAPLMLKLNADADVYVACSPTPQDMPAWLDTWEKTDFTLRTTLDAATPYSILTRRFQKDDIVSIEPDGDSRPFTIIIKERFPPPAAESISELSIHGGRMADGWHVLGNLNYGQRLHSDDGSTLAAFSSRLSGCDWIQTPQAESANPALQATFRVADHSEVFVALDPRIGEPPGWLNDWIQTDWYISTSSDRGERRELYKQRFAPGEVVALGPNGTAPAGVETDMYSVIVRTVRADQIYSPDEAMRASDGQVDWKIAVGVGDRYGLNFRYTSGQSPIHAKLSIIAERDGSIVCASELTFAATNGAWQVSRNRTCDDINAGTYFIRLEGTGLDTLVFESLQVE